ncbi:MAG: FtsX-like permease family protein [Acidimicrobiales bacterium]
MSPSRDRHAVRPAKARFSGSSLVWRAIRWRAGSSLVFLAVGVAAIAVASAVPTYLAAADQSLVSAQLASKPVTSTGFSIIPSPGGASASPAALLALARQLPGGAGPDKQFDTPIIQQTAQGSLVNIKSKQGSQITFLSRTGVCGQIHVVAGVCATKPGQVVISTRTAAAVGAKVGDRLYPKGGPPVRGVAHQLSVVVSGLYAAPPAVDDYWWGENPFPYGLPAGPLEISLDDGFVTLGTAVTLANLLPGADLAQVPLDDSRVLATALPALRSQLGAFQSRLTSSRMGSGSGLFAILGSISDQESQARNVAAVIGLELVLLALLVLYGVAAGTGAERGPDLTIAELRGLRRRSMAALALREPAVLLIVAAPVGLLVGWAVVRALAPHLFGAHTPVTIDSLTIGAVVLTFVGGLISSAMGVRSLIRPSLVNESRAAAARRAARGATIADALVVLLAVAAVVQLVTAGAAHGGLNGQGTAGAGTSSNPLAALAPALVALAVGVAAARLLPWAVRAISRSVRWSRRVGTSLACASITRRPGMARRVLIPTIAVGLLVFSIAAFDVARANRNQQAMFNTGAAVVDHVQVPNGLDFVTAVRKADPRGREAMAVSTFQSPSGSILAVDATRLASVGGWPQGISADTAAQVAHYLTPPAGPPLVVPPTSSFRLGIDLTAKIRPDPTIEIEVYNIAASSEVEVAITSVAQGSHQYSVDLDGVCSDSCDIVKLTPYWNAPPASSGQVRMPMRFFGLDAKAPDGRWVPVPGAFQKLGDWIGSSPAVQVTAAAGGLLADFDVDISATAVSLDRSDEPLLLPAVVTTRIVASNPSLSTPDQYPALGLDGADLTVSGRVVADAIPLLGDNAVLVDLTYGERAESGPSLATDEIWFAKPPSRTLLHRLSAEGIIVLSSTSVTSAEASLNRSGPALAFELFLLAALAAVLLTLGSLVFAVASGSRARAVEIAALTAVGVPRGLLRRSLIAEYGAVVLAGVLLGLLSGLITIHLALGALPEFAPGRVGPVFGFFVPWEEVLLACVATLVVLVAGTTLATSLVMRRAVPACLRISQ